jgi:hypothetical protein
MRLLPLCLTACLLLCTACAKRAPQTPPGSGRVTIGVTTTGPGADSMRFRLAIEPAGITSPVNARAGVFTTSSTPAGDQTVRLTDVPARCRVEGGAERRITVSATRPATVRFVVMCN